MQSSLFEHLEDNNVIHLPFGKTAYVGEKRVLMPAEKIPDEVCVKCPMAAHWHPMTSGGNKWCTMPLLIAKKIKVEDIMIMPGGCGARRADEMEVKKRLRSIWRKRKKAA